MFSYKVSDVPPVDGGKGRRLGLDSVSFSNENLPSARLGKFSYDANDIPSEPFEKSANPNNSPQSFLSGLWWFKWLWWFLSFFSFPSFLFQNIKGQLPRRLLQYKTALD